MSKQDEPSHSEPNAHTFEENVLGRLLEFQKRVMHLIRTSGLEGERLALAKDRITLLLDEKIAELEQALDGDFAGRLETAFGEVEQIVHGLSGDGDVDGRAQK
jgi:hypothetical protein